MGRKKKSTRDKAVDLRREGLTQEQIAKRLGLHQSTIARHLRAAEADGARLPPPAKSGRPRKAAKAAKKAERAERPPVDTPTEAELLGLSPHEAAKRLFGVHASEYLPEIRRRIRDAIADEELVGLDKWIALEVKIEKEVLAAIPPKPPDPTENPANVEARRRVRGELARLAKMRRASLEEKLCSPCRARL